MRSVTVLIFKVGSLLPKLTTIPATLEAQQAIVGGLIQPVDLHHDDRGTLSVVCNEEGLIFGLPFNRSVSLPHFTTDLMGDIYVARWDNEGEIVDLTADDVIFASKCMHWSANPARK